MAATRGMRQDLALRFAEAERRMCALTAESDSERRRLAAAVKRGELLSPARGVYVRPEYWYEQKPPQRALMVMYALQERHPEMVFCGVSAAIAYGLQVSYPLIGDIEAATTKKTHGRSRGLRGVKRHMVQADSIEVVRGLRVTSLERTVFDCVRNADFRYALAIADSAVRLGLKTKEQLIDAMKAMPALMGHARAAEVMKLANGLAESGGESVARAVMIERGFRLPELQRKMSDVVDGRQDYRVDFYWELDGQRDVIGELDGREKYENPQMTNGRSIVNVLADERLRESRVSGSDAKVMRFSYAQVLDRAYFTRLLCAYGIPRDAEIPWVAARADDPEARLERHERLFLGRWLPYAREHRLPMPVVA